VFDRQAVGVPARLARHVVAAHRLVTRENVFEGTCEHVVNTRFAVRRWRALVKTEPRPILGLLQRLCKHVMLTPKLEHLLLELWSVVTTLYFFKCQNTYSKTTTPRAHYVHPGREIRGTTRFRNRLAAIAS